MAVVILGILIVNIDIDVLLGGFEIPLFPSFLGFLLICLGIASLRKRYSYFQERDTGRFDLCLTAFSFAVMVLDILLHRFHILFHILYGMEMLLGHKQLHYIGHFVDEEYPDKISCVKLCEYMLIGEVALFFLELLPFKLLVEILEAVVMVLLSVYLFRLCIFTLRERRKRL